MSQPIHTLGRGCDLAPPRSSEQVRKPCEEMPPMRAQFFYCSPLPLDDPLTAAPPPTADSKNIKHLPRPFPKRDNKALLESWLGMGSKRDRRYHNRTCRPKLGVEPTADKKFSVTSLKPKIKQEVKDIKQEVKDIKESFKSTIANPETYQPTTGSVAELPPTESEAANCRQEHIAGENEGKPTLDTIVCPCKGSHLWCRKKTGKCKCASCPKAQQEVVVATHQPHIFPGKEPKPEEDTEPECLCNQPLEDSDRKIERSEEPKLEHSRPTEPLKPSKHRRGKSEENKPDNVQPECSCIEEKVKQDGTDEAKRSKHWEHNCKKGRFERERSENDLKPQAIHTELPKETKPAKMKSKNKEKGVAIDDQGESAQTKETKAWFDQQLKAQKEPLRKTEDEDDVCCFDSGFDHGEKEGDLASSASKLPSCCDDSKGGDSKLHEAEIDSSSKRKQSEAETIFSGTCDNSRADQLKDTEVSTRIPSCCDESKIESPSKQDQSESVTRFGSCCDEPIHNDRHLSERQVPGQHIPDKPEVHTCVEPKTATTSKNSKGKGKFFGRRQADGTADQDDGLYDDWNEDLPSCHTGLNQGDATNDDCICEPHIQTSKTIVPVAGGGGGNKPIKGGQTAGYGTTGKPFVKLPARGENYAPQDSLACDDEPITDPRKSHERDSTEDMEVEGCKAYKHKEHARCQPDIPVGPSRLHLVTLPCLVLKPIYWSPVNDQYPCIYGTWFYKDTMCPVEPAVANQLEKGYRENECWSQTWDDQLNSAIDVGPEGEEKIVHRLWPKEKDSKSPNYEPSEHILSTDPYCAARCFSGEAAAEGKVEESDAKPTAATLISKKYPNSQVIYKNSEEAFILKPSLCPSTYYGRRPLTKIRNGTCVGIAVVRGFDRKAWNKLYPPKKFTAVTKEYSKSTKHNSLGYNIWDACPACKLQDEPEKVTDLCLVVHGIGQKLSERMESFNFTYAVNSFRCEMKREFTNDDVKKVLREDFTGVTMLPVNWRANLSFEDGGPRKPGDKDRAGCDFTLNDITQPTIPRVRELISDVMLDIPYYMSGHKHKMIAALIAEANRIYRLWCKNNPGFHKDGRVHLISHSLGSVMVMEVLSKQPTTLAAELSWRPNYKYFDFQTTNCFLAGSPCAFFLLLESKSLVPRKGIDKPGCESENDSSKDVFGDAGTFGCLAIDNLYNIMHCNDPIAYRLNACVDARYGVGLKQAEVPDSSRSFMTTVSHAMKSAAGISQNDDNPVGEMSRPATITKMPSQMEMEVHDFTAEEMAEKKFCQLNENGQVDWILGNRPGILANQYIDMLSAHSSYWNNRDFIRFLCVEIGRQSGKMNTLSNMRARKKRRKVFIGGLISWHAQRECEVAFEIGIGMGLDIRKFRSTDASMHLTDAFPRTDVLPYIDVDITYKDFERIPELGLRKEGIEKEGKGRGLKRREGIGKEGKGIEKERWGWKEDGSKITLFVDTNDPIFSNVDIEYIPVSLFDKDKWIDKERLRCAAFFKIPISRTIPEGFPHLTLRIQQALCVLPLLFPEKNEQRDVLCKCLDRFYEIYWVEGKDISGAGVLEEVLRDVIGEEKTEGVLKEIPGKGKEGVERNTARALEEGAFGLPWMVCTNAAGKPEGFWGVDHLGQVVDHLGLERMKSKAWDALLLAIPNAPKKTTAALREIPALLDPFEVLVVAGLEVVIVELELDVSVSVSTVIPGVVGHWVELSEECSAVMLLEKVISAHFLEGWLVASFWDCSCVVFRELGRDIGILGYRDAGM
ncbi:DNA-directed RNA polymerase 1 subunit [Sclerotinia borealis F-4128]|uniref:DNA-directed RNA polymerase 1 subunit n=1 Tax=Sclerotinia borealis (strain F-4128) TaxID=1432307 RepID=W9CJ44_SCLBF|nr:DNA-directed RNA polymerase 1 subunit [Sclerotinia borealis F-4128]